MNQEVNKKVVDVKGAAEYLMVHRQTITRLANKGIIGRKVGNVWRFKTEDLDAYLSNPAGAYRGNEHGALQAGDAREG